MLTCRNWKSEKSVFLKQTGQSVESGDFTLSLSANQRESNPADIESAVRELVPIR